MATFVFTAKSNITPRGGIIDSTQGIPQFGQGIITIGNKNATTTNLFSDFKNRDILAQQLNKEFGVSFFNKDNIFNYSGAFRISKI